MKKLSTYLFLALSLVTLAACGKNEAAKLTSSTNNHQSKVQGQVTLILKTEKESKKKSVEIQKGDTVLDVLEESSFWKRYILFKKMMASSLRLMVFLKIKIRASIGCLMLMGNLVKKQPTNLRLKMAMKSNSIKKSIIKILNSVSEFFFYKVRK